MAGKRKIAASQKVFLKQVTTGSLNTCVNYYEYIAAETWSLHAGIWRQEA